MDFHSQNLPFLILLSPAKRQITVSILLRSIAKRKADLSDSKFVILRHDVDEIAYNALKIALLEHELGIGLHTISDCETKL